MFFSKKFRAPDLEASKNKPHQIRVLEFQAKEHSRTSTVQVQQLQARFDLDAARTSQNSKHESCRTLSWRSIAS